MKKKIILSAIFAILVTAVVALSNYVPDIIVTGTSGIWVDTRAYSSISDAITAVGASEKDIYIIRQETVTSLTIPATARLHFFGSGSIANTGQLTLNTRQIFAGDQQIFTGTGDIDFSPGSVVKSSWFSSFVESINVTNDDYLTLIVSKSANITADCIVGNNINLKWESPPNRLTANAGFTLSNIKNIEAGNFQLFAGAGSFNFLDGSRLKLDWFARLRSAVNWVGSSKVTLVISGSNTVDYNDSILSTTLLDFKSENGSLNVNVGVTLTIDSPDIISASNRQEIFPGAGTITFSKAGTVSPDWWETNSTPGTTDMSTAIQAAVNSNDDNLVQFNSGIYAIGTGITAKTQTWFKGLGSQEGTTGTELKAIAAVDIISYPAGSWYFGVEKIRFNGNSVGLSGIQIGTALGADSGSARLYDLYFTGLSKGIEAYELYFTSIKAFATKNSIYGFEFNGDCQNNRAFLWTSDIPVHLYVDDGWYNIFQIQAIQMTGATTTLSRFIRLTNGSTGNYISGNVETEFVPTSGDLVLIDDSGVKNIFQNFRFVTAAAATQNFDEIQVGVSTDSSPCLKNVFRDVHFDNPGVGYSNINLEYADWTHIDSCDNTDSTDNYAVRIDESDTSKATHTKLIQTGIEQQRRVITSDVTVPPSWSLPTWIEIDATGGNIQLTLPLNVAADGGHYKFIRIDSSANTVTITRNGVGNIQPIGAQSTYLYSQYDWIELLDSGAGWWIVGSRQSVSVTWNPSSLADGVGETKSVVFTDANLGDFVQVSAPYDLQDCVVTGYVQAYGTIEIRLQNESGGVRDLASGNWKVQINR